MQVSWVSSFFIYISNKWSWYMTNREGATRQHLTVGHRVMSLTDKIIPIPTWIHIFNRSRKKNFFCHVLIRLDFRQSQNTKFTAVWTKEKHNRPNNIIVRCSCAFLSNFVFWTGHIGPLSSWLRWIFAKARKQSF